MPKYSTRPSLFPSRFFSRFFPGLGLLVGSSAAVAACFVIDPVQPPLVAPAPPVPEPVAEAEDAGVVAKPPLAKRIAKIHVQMRDAFNEHDAERFAAFFTDDASVVFSGLPEAHGRADVAAGLEKAFAAVSNMKATDVRVFQKGSTQAVEFVVTGTMSGDYEGIKASKKALGERRLALVAFDDDGLVTRWREYADTPGMLAQMRGAKDAPAVPALPAKRAESHVADEENPDAGASSGDDGADEGGNGSKWLQALNDAYDKDDPRALDSLDATNADATLYFLGGKTVQGKALAEFHAEFAKAFPDAKYKVDGSFGVDDFVIAERTMTATQKAKFGGLAPSKKPVTLHVADVFLQDDDGKLQHQWSYADLGEVSGPPPGAKPGAPKQARQ